MNFPRHAPLDIPHNPGWKPGWHRERGIYVPSPRPIYRPVDQPLYVTPALVGTPNTQFVTAGGASSQSITINSTTAGNTLFLCWVSALSATISSITGAGTWTQRFSYLATVAARVDVWACPNISAGVTSLTINFSGATNQTSQNVSEWSGMPSTLTVDGSATTTNVAVTGNAAVGASITPTAGKALLIIAAISEYYQVSAVSAGWTAFVNPGVTGDGGAGACMFAYRIVTSASGSYAPTWTTGGNFVASTSTEGYDGASAAVAFPFHRNHDLIRSVSVVGY